MKKVILCIFFLPAFLLSVNFGLAQQSYVAEKVVAVVGNSVVLLSEVEETMRAMIEEQKKQNYTFDRDIKCSALELNMLRKLLARQAETDSIYVRSSYIPEAVEEQISSLIEQYGSVVALEKVFHKPVYQIRSELNERYLDVQKAIDMESHIKEKVTITPSEVERFYKTLNKDSLPEVPEQYSYSQIVMYPASAEEAKLRARERLLELRQRIINGDRFATLARLYSKDASASQGGELDWMPKEYFEKPYGDALEKMSAGQISDIVETIYGFHIIELIEERNGQYKTRHILIRPEYTVDDINKTVEHLDSVGDAIKKGEISFADAALKYSEDKISRLNQGKASNTEFAEVTNRLSAKETSTRFFRENLGQDYVALRLLKPGEISSAYQTEDFKGNKIVKIVRLDEIVPRHRVNIKDDYVIVETIALEDKKEEYYENWLKKKMAAMYIKIDPAFHQCDFEYSGWVK